MKCWAILLYQIFNFPIDLFYWEIGYPKGKTVQIYFSVDFKKSIFTIAYEMLKRCLT